MNAILGRSRKLVVALATTGAVIFSIGAVREDHVRASRLGKTHGTLEIESSAASGGAALATRIQVRGAGLFGDTQSHLAAAGRARFSLPAGAYEVVVSHGPEWSLFTRRVSLVGGEKTSVHALLRREVRADDLTACDLHVHTDESPDGTIAAHERVTSLAAEDVTFAVVTDHNRVTDFAPQLVGSAHTSLPGVEVTTWAPEFGHFNVFPRRTPPRYQATSQGKLLAELREEPGSFVQINHPRLQDHIGYFALTDLSRIGTRAVESPPLLEAADAIEVWNGYDLGRPAGRDEVFRDWQALLARGLHITATGNSDSHGASPPYVGYPRTVVQLQRRRARDPQHVLAALKAGRSFVTSGPTLHVQLDGKAPGESVWLASTVRSVRLRVEVSTPSWMRVSELEVYVAGQRILETALPARNAAGTQSVELTVPVHAPAPVVVVVRGPPAMKSFFGRSVEPYAFSNPVWLRGEPRAAR